MSLIRYSHPMLSLQQQINRMFDQFDSDLLGNLEELGDGSFAPAVDIKEDAEAYTVHLEVPGVRQEDLDLALNDNVLVIRGTKAKPQIEGRFRRVERSYGTFVRTLSLPRNIEETGVTANLQDGVLVIHLPKREDTRPRQIPISIRNSGGRTLEAANEAEPSAPALEAESQTAPQEVAVQDTTQQSVEPPIAQAPSAEQQPAA